MATKTYPELAPPDVEVRVETVTVTPTTLVPTLPTVVVGPCYQIVEVTEAGEPNDEAIVTLPATLGAADASGGTYTGLGAKGFTLSINGGTGVTIDFPASPANPTPAQVVAEINADLTTAGKDGMAIAEVLPGYTGGNYRFQIRTVSAGSNQSLNITAEVAGTLTILGLALGRVTGKSGYEQGRLAVPTVNFPAPRDNMDELDFDPAEVTVALDIGTASMKVLSPTSALERAGRKGIRGIEDGDYDGYTPRLKITNVAVDERLAADPYHVGCGNSNAVYKLSQAADGMNITAFNDYSATGIDGKTLILSVCGSDYQVITFASGDTIDNVITKINAYFPGLASKTGSKLVLDTGNLTVKLPTLGRESYIHIHPSSTALDNLDAQGTTPNISADVFYGTWFPVAVGDDMYINGELIGEVTRIIEAAATYTLFELSNEVSQLDYPDDAPGEAVDHRWYFVSKNLTAAIVPSSKPTPEVSVTSDGNVYIKSLLLRDDSGAPFIRTESGGKIIYGTATLYIGYKALRLDVSPAAEAPMLLSFDSPDGIDDEIGPINIDNPLAMGVYMSMLAGPERTVYGLGLSEATDGEGTAEAYTSAAAFLANHEVYTIVPLTQDLDILQMFATHVSTYSSIDNKLERCLFGTVEIPTRGPNTALASGTDGMRLTDTTFNTNVAGLTTVIRESGVDPDTFVADGDELYLTIESTTDRYQLASVSGAIVTINPAPTDTEFYYTGNLPANLINEQHSIMLRGALLVDGSGNPDKDLISQALADTGASFKTSRVIIGVPGEVEIVDNGVQVLVPSYYAACSEAGKKSQLPPHIGFTNTQTIGLVGVKKSNDYFTKKQMNVAAAGGIWWWWKETPASAVTCRHQLTTDTTTIESREWSLQTALDYLAKTVRLAIRPLLGRYIINDDLMRLVDSALGGIENELVQNRHIFAELAFGEVTVMEDYPDSLEVVVDTVRFYPFNKLTCRIRV